MQIYNNFKEMWVSNKKYFCSTDRFFNKGAFQSLML